MVKDGYHVDCGNLFVSHYCQQQSLSYGLHALGKSFIILSTRINFDMMPGLKP